MGAELFIEEIRQTQEKKYWPPFNEAVRKRDQFPETSEKWAIEQKKVEKYHELLYSRGYFRDPYFVDGIFPWLGLSWDEVVSMVDENARLKTKNLKKLREMVANAKVSLPRRPKWMDMHQWLNLKANNKSPEWRAYIEKRRKGLLKFLDTAIHLKSPVLCSL